MADRFLDFVNGSNSNGGTSLVDAWKTPLAAGWSGVASGDRIIIKGDENDVATHYRPTALSELLTFKFGLTGKSDITIIPYNDRGYCFRGDFPLPTGSWESVAGSTYRQDIGTGRMPSGAQLGVTWEYDSSTTTLVPGYPETHYGVLEPQADAASVEGGVGRSFYNNATGFLYVNVGLDPAIGTVTVCRGTDTPLFDLVSSTRLKMFGGLLKLIGLHNTSIGCLLGLNGATGCLIDSVRAIDSGYHNFETYGVGVTNNTFRNCHGEGGGDTGTIWVIYAQSGTHSGNRVIDCTALVRTHLDMAGTPLGGTGANQTGFYWHYGSGQDVVTDLEFRGCMSICYSPSSPGIRGYGGVDAGTFAGSRYSNVGRPVRYVDCGSRGDTSWTINAPIYVLRGDFRFTNAGPLSSAGSTGCLRMSTDGGGTSKRGIPLFEGSIIFFNLDDGDGTPSTQYASRAQSTATFHDDSTGEYEGPTFIGCTFVDMGVATHQVNLFDYQNEANYMVACEGCILGFTGRGGSNQKLCATDSTAAADKHVFDSNHYIGIGTTADWSANTSFDTEAEFTHVSTGIDRHAKVTSSGAAVFRSTSAADGAAARTSAAAIAGVRINPTHKPICDIWGRPFMAQPGAWQEQPDNDWRLRLKRANPGNARVLR